MSFSVNAFAQAEVTEDSLIYKTETIDVDALKGIERSTPVTFENIDKKEIDEKYWMQDLPMFLNGNTSIMHTLNPELQSDTLICLSEDLIRDEFPFSLMAFRRTIPRTIRFIG
ncbi:MAG: hypothetical protein R3A12_01100 [Ignavibacteria bacterium]